MNTKNDGGAEEKPRTIDEICGDPPGTFAKFCNDHPDIDGYIMNQNADALLEARKKGE